MQVPGRHNVANALAALGGLSLASADVEACAEALQEFPGVARRLELKGEANGARVYDDYAHHPTEVAAALDAARTVVGEGRILAVHQPHLYSRTKAFAGEFAAVLESRADHTVVLDVDGAREDPVPGVTGDLVSSRFTDPSAVDYLPDWRSAADRVAAIARPGDFVITLGCGSVYRIVPQILDALGAREGANP
jgi:UDP-N-acetylmuramate--alanine ligase